jgi:anti-sigma factor RsiW
MQLTCQEFVELVTAYFERALDDPTMDRVEEHLALCDSCTAYAEQMDATVAALRTLPPEPIPDELHRAIAAALGRTGCTNGRRALPPASSRRLGPDAGS